MFAVSVRHSRAQAARMYGRNHRLSCCLAPSGCLCFRGCAGVSACSSVQRAGICGGYLLGVGACASRSKRAWACDGGRQDERPRVRSRFSRLPHIHRRLVMCADAFSMPRWSGWISQHPIAVTVVPFAIPDVLKAVAAVVCARAVAACGAEEVKPSRSAPLLCSLGVLRFEQNGA